MVAVAHTGLGWVKMQQQQQQQQQQPEEHMQKQKEKVFQVAHVHFLTSLKLIGDTADAACCSAAFKLSLRLYRGLVTSLWQSRWLVTCDV